MGLVLLLLWLLLHRNGTGHNRNGPALLVLHLTLIRLGCKWGMVIKLTAVEGLEAIGEGLNGLNGDTILVHKLTLCNVLRPLVLKLAPSAKDIGIHNNEVGCGWDFGMGVVDLALLEETIGGAVT